jgi:glyoxylase-like metal-dependent hydrolase (beta-lactamase superfamily II)
LCSHEISYFQSHLLKLLSSDTHHKEDHVIRTSTSFSCTEINPTTFLIIEDDSYGEHPHIYIKIYPALIFISDTGCNSPRQMNKTITSLRQYLESYPTPANNHSPLNPNGSKPYLIFCTHAHYDHILGIPGFLSSSTTDGSTRPNPKVSILASSHDKSFILTDLPTHSLCKHLHIPTPEYTISHWARHLEYLSYLHPAPAPSPAPALIPLRIQTLHIPGHTPDSLAWYDIDEHHLYVGDAFYARKRPTPPKETITLPTNESPTPDPEDDAPIIFPSEGNLITYTSSLTLLLSFIRHQNYLLLLHWPNEPISEPPPAHRTPPRVLLGSGHITSAADAETMTVEVQTLFRGIISGAVKASRSEWKRGEVWDYWVEPRRDGDGDGDGKGEGGRYSVFAPRRLVEEAREHFRKGGEMEMGYFEG